MTPVPKPRRFDYHAAFSYSSENAEEAGYVRRVREVLTAKEIKVYDYATDEAKIETAGLDLEKTLKDIYEYKAMLVFAFISKAYETGPFTPIEWKAAKRAAKRKPGYLIVVRMEETGMSLPDIWLDGTLPADKLAKQIEGTIRRPPRKPWWFYLSMEVKAAAAAALLVLILFARPAIDHFRPSRTSIAPAAADAQGITMHVTNSGPKSSTLVGYRLKFGAIPITDADLRLKTPASATIAPGEHDVQLMVRELLPKCSADGSRLNNREIEPLLGQQNVTFEIDVQESDDTPGHPTTRTATMAAARLQPFVRKWVPGRVPPC
jgi:hypothetical protein